jgi:mannitol/fructose-specific phosphotransferase system IIA component (Ntr-type)
VALVSSNDHFLTEYTKERVSNNFPWFKLVGVYRKADLNHSSPKNADLVLSTVDLDLENTDAIVTIDPFLTELDIQHIQNWINEHAIQKNNNLKEQENVKLSDLLFERNIIFHDRVDDWEEAVYLAGKPLVENKDITHGYLDAIIQINKAYGPYSVVAPNIALLHAKSREGVNRLCLGLMVLKEGIHFGSRKFDPVNILFVIGIPDTHSHLEALHDLINIIRSKGFNENIMNCPSASEAVEIILRHSKQVN